MCKYNNNNNNSNYVFIILYLYIILHVVFSVDIWSFCDAVIGGCFIQHIYQDEFFSLHIYIIYST